MVSPDKGDLEEDSYRNPETIIHAEGREVIFEQGTELWLAKEGRKTECLYKYKRDSITANSIRQNYYSGHMIKWAIRGSTKVYQRILKRFEWPGMKKGMRENG